MNRYRLTKVYRPADALGARPSTDPRAEAGIDNGTRTDVVEGEATPPKVGHRFVIHAPPLEAGNAREITTSPVVRVHGMAEGTALFRTESGSTYHLERLTND